MFCSCVQRLVSPPGDFQFSVSSDDNSEFWLSSDESPLNARLLVYVGQVSTDGPQREAALKYGKWALSVQEWTHWFYRYHLATGYYIKTLEWII